MIAQSYRHTNLPLVDFLFAIMTSYPKSDVLRAVCRVVGIYLAAGILWIVVSDSALAFLTLSDWALAQMQTYKGVAFVTVTACILFVVLRREWSLRAQNEEQLRKHAELLNITQDAVIVRNWHDGRITFWNGGAERLYGWTAAEAEGNVSQELLYYEDGLEQRQSSNRALLQQGVWRGERRQKTKEGRDLIVDAHLTLVRDENGQPHSVLCINSDVTEKRILEQQLRQAQKLESLGELAGGVTHDFNNLLTIINGYTELCLNNFPEDFVEQRRMLEQILNAGRRSAAVVSQILSFLRQKEPIKEKVDVPGQVSEVVKLIRETFPANIEIQVKFEEGLPNILGDTGQIQQVLLNLCVNARDAMPDGGAISMSVRKTYRNEVLPLADGDYICIEVADVGTGIPPELQERLFEPFVTSKPEGQGTGLGLSTAFSIIRAHGGWMNFRTYPGEGTTFFVFLPIADRQCDQDSPEGKTLEREKEGTGEIVLVVEDEPALLDFACRCLNGHGYQAVPAKSGQEALDLIAEHSAEIKTAIINYQLPGVSGIKVASEIRKSLPRLPVLMVSGYIAQREKERLHEIGVLGILGKPFGVLDLIAAVDGAIKSSEAPALPFAPKTADG